VNLARYRLAIVGAALLFSTGGAAIKYCALDGFQVACLRSAVAGVTIALLAPASRRGWTRRTLLVALCYAGTLVQYVMANKLTTAANAIFLQSTSPLYVAILAPLLLRERIQRRDLLLLAVIAAGLALVFADRPAPTASSPNPMLGNVLAAVAGFTWSVTLVGLRSLERERKDGGGSLAAVVSGNVIASLGTLPFAWPFTGATTADWLVIVYLGTVQIGAAYLLLAHGFTHVPAFEASLLILVEPAFNPFFAWLVHREVPGTWALAGGLAIVLASTAKTWLDQRREVEAPTGVQCPPEAKP
jgi:drug/metabolite transporter (DMT)-like permease